MAEGEEDLLKVWHLVHREYLQCGYTQAHELDLRYSIHDALPEAATFMVEKDGEVIATMTAYPDSPLGLPADEIYKEEIDAIRGKGRTPVEIGRLTIRQDHVNERSIMTSMFDAIAVYARRFQSATDLVVTVNPRHAIFYARALMFEMIGGQKQLGSVCGAPAVLLRLDMDMEEQARRHARGEGPVPQRPMGCHALYSHVSSSKEEMEMVDRMRNIHRKPAESFIRRYFMQLRPLIQSLPSCRLYFIEECYPDAIRSSSVAAA
jgi:hypothetical protein